MRYVPRISEALDVVQSACSAFDARDWAGYARHLDEGIVYRSGARGAFDRDSAVAADRAMADALEVRMERHSWVADDDRVAWKWRLTGRHVGELMGLPATGNEVDINGASFATVVAGKITEIETFPDRYLLLSQLGALP